MSGSQTVSFVRLLGATPRLKAMWTFLTSNVGKAKQHIISSLRDDAFNLKNMFLITRGGEYVVLE